MEILNLLWEPITTVSTAALAIAAIVAGFYTHKTWTMEKLPIVHAIGTFIISKKVQTNNLRDQYISQPDSQHTFQIVNVGRGAAKNVTLSVRKSVIGRFLEDVNPLSFSLPANKGTKELKEILRVHGQRFVPNDEYELVFEKGRKIAYFYIHFEDYEGKKYLIKVRVDRVKQADGRLGDDIKRDDGVEVWKVMDNITESI